VKILWKYIRILRSSPIIARKILWKSLLLRTSLYHSLSSFLLLVQVLQSSQLTPAMSNVSCMGYEQLQLRCIETIWNTFFFSQQRMFYGKELGKWHILPPLAIAPLLLPWSITLLHLGKKWQLALVTSLERTQSLLSNRNSGKKHEHERNEQITGPFNISNPHMLYKSC